MDFKQIIKQEWEKEFPLGVDEQPAIFGMSIFESVYQDMVERICIQVWNEALIVALDNVEVICDSSETFQSIDEQSILKFKIDEQSTNTAEI